MFTGYLHYEDKIPTAEFQPATLSVTGKMPRTTKPWEIIWDLTYQTYCAKKNDLLIMQVYIEVQLTSYRIFSTDLKIYKFTSKFENKEFINKPISQVI